MEASGGVVLGVRDGEGFSDAMVARVPSNGDATIGN